MRKAIVCSRSSTVRAMELGALGGEDRRVRPERDRGAGVRPAAAWADDLQLALRLAALGVLLAVALAVAVDLDHEPLGQGVDHRHADAVEAARDLVAVAAELAAGVQHGEDDLGRALALVRPDGYGSTGMPRPSSSTRQPPSASRVTSMRRAVARHRLVDGVVDDLPDEVVEAGQTGRADVHARALAHGIEALEDLDVLGAS